MHLKYKNKSGVGLVEIVIASAIISTTLLVLLYVYIIVSKISNNNINSLKATQLAEETVEVLKYLRDSGFSRNIATLDTGTTYHPYWDINIVPNTWTATTSNILLEDNYEISIDLSEVYRDADHDVVTSGGTLDANSKKADISVSWVQNGVTNTKQVETYIFNIFNN